jgi:hypothetical protein
MGLLGRSVVDLPLSTILCDVESSPCVSQFVRWFVGMAFFVPSGLEVAISGSSITVDTIFGCLG